MASVRGALGQVLFYQETYRASGINHLITELDTAQMMRPNDHPNTDRG